MQLIIDKGNSYWKIAVFDTDIIIENYRFETITWADFSSILSRFSIDKGIISSVSDIPNDIVAPLKEQIYLVELSHTLQLPIRIDYKTPNTLGKDRIAGAVGAYKLFPNQDVLIIDAGTCITYDMVDATGTYLGGSISPGLQMRFKALHNFTHKLPLIQSQEWDELTGKSTEESILTGVLNGIRFEIDGFIQQYQATYPNIKIIITGGDIVYFEKTLKNDIFVDSNIVLIGLKEILNYNA